MSPITKINFDDYTEAIPAYLMINMMPLSCIIAEGMAINMLSYAVMKALTGKSKEISMIILSVFFVLKFEFFLIEASTSIPNAHTTLVDVQLECTNFSTPVNRTVREWDFNIFLVKHIFKLLSECETHGKLAT